MCIRDRVFHPANPAKKVEEAKGYTALFGHFVDREEAFDGGVALCFRAPHSYTGEDVVELSCQMCIRDRSSVLSQTMFKTVSPLFSHFRLDPCPLGCCRKAVIY